jgi:hypothetical protein
MGEDAMAGEEFDSPRSWIVAAVVCYIFFAFGLWGALDAYRDADERGIVKAGRGTIQGEYLWHFFLACPTVSFLAGCVCLYIAWKVAHE